MGRIESDGSEAWPLPERAIVGRSRACEIWLQDPRVSAEHALLRWNDGAWVLQDLASRNGTFVAGRRLATGERVALSAADALGFGQPGGFRLASAEPPAPFAVPVDGGSPILACNGLLALPDADEPELTLHRDPERGWALERAGRVETTHDRAVVQTRPGALRLFLPGALSPTEEAGGMAVTIAALELRFRVSRDEGAVELLGFHGQSIIDLKVRAHHSTLLLLARARLRDAGREPERQGWLAQDDVCQQLGCTLDRLYINIFRIRRQLAEAGVMDAGNVIERRAGTGLLRIGVSQLEVVPLR